MGPTWVPPSADPPPPPPARRPSLWRGRRSISNICRQPRRESYRGHHSRETQRDSYGVHHRRHRCLRSKIEEMASHLREIEGKLRLLECEAVQRLADLDQREVKLGQRQLAL